MRKKLLMLSALTCIAGGSALLSPANGQGSYPSCESIVGDRCSGGGDIVCQQSSGDMESLRCFNGTWHYN